MTFVHFSSSTHSPRTDTRPGNNNGSKDGEFRTYELRKSKHSVGVYGRYVEGGREKIKTKSFQSIYKEGEN